MKLITSCILTLAAGIVIGYSIAKHSQPSSEELSKAIIDGMAMTESFSGTIWKEKFENVVKQAMENPQRDNWAVLESNQMTGIIFPSSLPAEETAPQQEPETTNEETQP